MIAEGFPALAHSALETSSACSAKKEGRSHRTLEDLVRSVMVSLSE